MKWFAGWTCAALLGAAALSGQEARASDKLRVIIETDAGGDPDDEQSMVRFLLYANEWDVEGIIANRLETRLGENHNPERTGFGVVQRLLEAYGQCFPKLSQHQSNYPSFERLRSRTVAGYNDTEAGVNLIVAAVDSADARPLWYSDWGTDSGGATNNLRRALDRVLRERGAAGYAQFKSRLRLSSRDAFGEHTTTLTPPFPLWIDTFRPEIDRRRWYHRFSALTATAGGFNLVRDVLNDHGPLGALYPTNTTHWAKEGDSMTFLYLVPTGMNDPEQPGWGSWAGRYGSNPEHLGKPYYWANVTDSWNGVSHREQSLARWAADLQNDFKARLDWCVRDFPHANHPPTVRLKVSAAGSSNPPPAAGSKSAPERVSGATADNSGLAEESMVARTVRAGETVTLDATASRDPDGNSLRYAWFHYPEPGGQVGASLEIAAGKAGTASFVAPARFAGQTVHIILAASDTGEPPLTRYGRVLVRILGNEPTPR